MASFVHNLQQLFSQVMHAVLTMEDYDGANTILRAIP